ncbi:type II secretion system protein N [Hyphobacterium sp.]|uniref:type II secretion system protein N n=1 Tax=Hyphobacterium sp. TaxID=2004662 RepID=UPI003BA8D2D2
MSLLRLGLIGVVFVIIGLIALMPLSFAHTLSGNAFGPSATTYGQIWYGRVYGARFGPAAFERIDLGLRPVSLLTGKAVFDWTVSDVNARGEGQVFAGFGTSGVESARLTTSLGGLGLTLPAISPEETVSFNIAHLSMNEAGCQEVDGEVRTSALIGLAGHYGVAAPMLSGPLSCNHGVLEAALSGDSDAFDLTILVSLAPSGLWRWQAEADIQDASLTAVFSSLGFVQDGEVWRARGEGQL